MFFGYFRPHTDIRDYVSSYYTVSFPETVNDVMRAEIANIRFMLKGTVITELPGEPVRFSAPSSILCGPTYKASAVTFEAGTQVIGAAITPLGWCRLLGMPADQFSDQLVPLEEVVAPQHWGLIRAIFEAEDDAGRVKAMDALFGALVSHEYHVNEAFMDAATQWLVDPEPNELEDFLASVDVSHRQVERLCKAYFGSAPKRLHRKFRALHAANRLCWEELSDWRDIAAAAYYDQAHFYREFKQFNGRTPKEFVEGPHLLVRMTLEERRRIDHGSPFSLVG